MELTERANSALPVRLRNGGDLPSWPTFSIGLLLVLSAIFQPWLVTVLNLYLLFLAALVWTATRVPFDKYLFQVVLPFGLIAVIGMAGGVGADRYLYLKDLWYVSNPPVIVCVGFLFYCSSPDTARGLRAFVIGGSLLALLYLVPLAIRPDLLTRSYSEIRAMIGTGFYAPVLAFTILCAYFGNWREGLKLPPRLAWACYLLCIVTMGVSQSRTTLLVAFIGLLAAMGVFSRREWLRLGLTIVIVVLLFWMLRTVVDLSSAATGSSFIGKLVRSLDEISIHEYGDFKSINQNWRGYETARALKMFASGEPWQWFFGHGFGAQVGLGQVALGKMLKIPILHNGYAYLLVKGGAISILLFVLALAVLYRAGRLKADSANGRLISPPARILQAIAVSLAAATWFISGVFNKLDMFPLLLAAGFLLAATTRERPGYR